MPHSSGGGSHSGGSHFSSGGGGFHGYRVSRSYFTDAKRYVVYRAHFPVYRYLSRRPEEIALLRWILLVFYLVLIVDFSYQIYQDGMPPKKLGTDDYDTTIVIEDRAQVLYDAEEIRKTLLEFQETTGITPAVVTVYNEDWLEQYHTLEKYAYELYVSRWPDEKHWLIVYSQPRSANEGEWIDWYWEGMQGNDTDPILTPGKTKQFTESMQDYLRANVIDRAITRSFSELTPAAMDAEIDGIPLLIMILGILFLIGHMIYMVFYKLNVRGMKHAILCPENAGEDVCSSCQGTYVIGTVNECPYCGAEIPIHHEK